MSDTLHELERLQQLRANGSLTDAEFAAEKARILSAVPDREPVDAQDYGGWRSSSLRSFMVIAIVILALAGVTWLFARTHGRQDAATKQGGVTTAIPSAVKSPSVAAPMPSPTSPWTSKIETDPMSDDRIVSATARLSADTFSIAVSLTCRGGTELDYVLSAFDTQGQPANMRRQIVLTPTYVEQATYAVRLNDAPARSATDYALRYSNMIRFDTNGARIDGGPSLADQASRAKRVAVELQLEAGQPVVVIDQNNPAVRSVLNACTAGFEQRQRRAAEIRQADHERCLTDRAREIERARGAQGMGGDTYGMGANIPECDP